MSPSIVLFFSMCVASCFLMGLVVIYPWFYRGKSTDNQLMRINVASFYERLQELEDDKNRGIIDNESYEGRVVELKRQLLSTHNASEFIRPASLKSRLIVLLWIPILAAMAYLLTMDRTSVFKLWQATDTVGQVADDLLTGKIDMPPEWATQDSAALISSMQVNVHRHAYDPMRWFRLSELFLSLGANTQSLEALARAYRLAPEDEEIASTYAQIGFFANNGQLDNTGRQVLSELLTNNPKHEGAMMLMAMGETQAGNYNQAKAWANRLRSAIAAKSGDHRAALQSLDEMLLLIDDKANKARTGIEVLITLDSAMLPRVDTDDVLFVAVVSASGGAPYAVQKMSVGQFDNGQLSLVLSDANAMLEGRTLSAARADSVQLLITARISKSGDAITQSGDLLASPVVIDQNTQNASLVINQIAP